VVAAAGDLVEDGIVASLERPGGNITGQILRDLELSGKRLELLKETVLHIAHVAVLTDPNVAGDRRVPMTSQAKAAQLGTTQSPIVFVAAG
jgi:putative ABC transport system substrate-binding protein